MELQVNLCAPVPRSNFAEEHDEGTLRGHLILG